MLSQVLHFCWRPSCQLFQLVKTLKFAWQLLIYLAQNSCLHKYLLSALIFLSPYLTGKRTFMLVLDIQCCESYSQSTLIPIRESTHTLYFARIKLLLGLKLLLKFLNMTEFSNLIRPGFHRVNIKVELRHICFLI